jgi:hypothetical protein
LSGAWTKISASIDDRRLEAAVLSMRLDLSGVVGRADVSGGVVKLMVVLDKA